LKIKFLGGVGEIGGNKFLIAEKDEKILIDFGKSYSMEKRFFMEPFLYPKSIDILVQLDILPKDVMSSYVGSTNPEVDSVFISHPHGDHYDYIRYLSDNIPVYCGVSTLNLILGREAGIRGQYKIVGFSDDKEIIYKNFKTFRTGDEIELGRFRVIPIHVDHSVPGSYGFMIESKQNVIAYSGDFRLHGHAKKLTLDFIEKAKEFKPDLLMVEGTNIDASHVSSEDEVYEKLRYLISSCKGFVLACFSYGDVDRLRSFLKAAIENKRYLVLPSKQAYLLRKISNDPNFRSLDLTNEYIKVYIRDKKRYAPFERQLLGELKQDKIVDSEWISKNQEKCILSTSLFFMNEIFTLKPIPGSIFILSSSEPFDEESTVTYEKLLSWLEELGIPLYQVHASGHASPLELRNLVNEIKPRGLTPIHTEKPEMMIKFLSNLGVKGILVEKHDEIDLRNIL